MQVNKENLLAKPNSRQMEWYRRGKVAFIHFSINTFTGNEWGDGTDSPKIFNPTSLDCRQWISTLKEAGFSSAILTAKHHDGFCLWQSAYTEYSVKNSPYKNGNGDIVREFTDACHEFGIEAGIYLSPWDRNYPGWGTQKYNEYYENQLKELLTCYGEISEIWWDGAGSEKAQYDWKHWTEIIRNLQPGCVIFGSLGAAPYVDVRWVGNEFGIAGEPCFATIKENSVRLQITEEMNSGDPDGERFIPAECDVSIRPGWFYHKEQDKMVKTAADLTEYWFLSAGRNAGILLNIPPDKNGLICENDRQSLINWERNMVSIFKTNLALNATVDADNDSAQNLLSNRENDVYTANTLTPQIIFSFSESVTFSCVRIEEVIESGHRVRGFAIDTFYENKWNTIIERECIGFCKCEHFKPITATKVRIRITNAVANPILRYFGLFKVPDGIFDKTPQTDKVTDLTAGESAHVTKQDKTIYIDLGGIFAFNTVIMNAGVSGDFEIQIFDGAVYRKIYSGTKSISEKTCSFPEVKGSYRLKIVFNTEIENEDIIPQVYLIK